MSHTSPINNGDRRSPILPIAFMLLTLLFIIQVMLAARGDGRPEADGCHCEPHEPMKPDPRIGKILDRLGAIENTGAEMSVNQQLGQQIIMGKLDSLLARKPVVVEKIVEREKIVEKVVEKIVNRDHVPPATMEAMREADGYIRMWWFVSDPEENRHRARTLKKLAAAIADAEKVKE